MVIQDIFIEGVAWGLPRRLARKVVTQATDAAAAALSMIDKDDHPGVSEEAWAIVEERAARAVAAADR
jgi:hypothetical protein